MSEQSIFSKKPKKVLFYITKELLDSDFDWENPYDSYYEDMDLLERYSKYFDETPISSIDLEFFYKFIQNNLNTINQIIQENKHQWVEGLEIPIAIKYVVDYQLDVSKREIESYETTWDSYDEDWVRESIRQAHSDGNFDWYDGIHIDTDTDYYEVNDENIIDVKPSNKDLNEHSIINSLDKKTLLQLRELIDKRLRVI